MKMTPRKLLLVILAAALCAAANSPHPPIAAAHQNSRTMTMAALHGRITVRRDERGIPYLEATNDLDLYFAQGYVTANDRLWQMDLMRRTARGELAEVL